MKTSCPADDLGTLHAQDLNLSTEEQDLREDVYVARMALLNACALRDLAVKNGYPVVEDDARVESCKRDLAEREGELRDARDARWAARRAAKEVGQ